MDTETKLYIDCLTEHIKDLWRFNMFTWGVLIVSIAIFLFGLKHGWFI